MRVNSSEYAVIDEDQQNKMGEESFKKISEEFTLERSAKGFIDALESCMS